MSRTPSDRCPDAETLAAWADGTLYGAAAEGLEAHLADCERCQAVLATFAATDPEPVVIATTPPDADELHPAHVIPFKTRSSPMRWALPVAIGTIAASLIMWVAWPKMATKVAPQPTASIARNQAVTPPSTSGQGGGGRGQMQPRPTPAVPPADAPRLEAATKQATPASVNAAAKPSPAAPPPELRQTADRTTLPGTPPAGVAAMPPPPPPVIAAAPTPNPVAIGAAGQMAGGSAVANVGAAGGAGAGGAARSVSLTRTFLEAIPGGVEFGPDPVASVTLTATDPGRGGGRGGGGGGGGRATPPNPSPSRLIRWRVLLSGLIEKTIDGGKSWSRIVVDPGASITTGAAPSATVCWLVGKAGAVLRSTDGGSTFTKVVLPETADLQGVTATDDKNATVTTTDGRRLSTTDGGQTWHRS